MAFKHCLPAQSSLPGDCSNAGISPVRPEIGVKTDHQVDLDRRPSECLERLGTKKIMFNPERNKGTDSWPAVISSQYAWFHTLAEFDLPCTVSTNSR